MTICLKLKTTFALRSFQRALICSFLIAGIQVMLEKCIFLVRVLAKARFPDSKATDPKSGPYYLPLDINETMLKISAL
jgi:hypothetical protein